MFPDISLLLIHTPGRERHFKEHNTIEQEGAFSNLIYRSPSLDVILAS